MTAEQFQVRKTDLSKHRVVEHAVPEPDDGEVLVGIDRFALTANNVTYGVVGERIGYWNFFPAVDNDGDWGIIPVWGFADVVASRADGVAEGGRFYGYFPMATHLVMRPTKVCAERMIDGAAHRQELSPVYNSYRRVALADDRTEDTERMLLHPLYATSFCLHDFFCDNGWFGADQVAVISASSKTAIGVAYALADDAAAPASVGVTSARNLERVKSLDLYDTVHPYEDLDTIDADRPTAIIDMSGSGAVLSDLHRHLGDNMRFCSNVGLTHWSQNTMGPGFIRERSEMFFAPGHIQKRAKDWGPGVFEEKSFEFWRSAAERSRSWLKIETASGLIEAQGMFDGLRDGVVSPRTGLVVDLHAI